MRCGSGPAKPTATRCKTAALQIEALEIEALASQPATTPATSGPIEGNPRQLLIQLYGVAVTLVWSGGVTFILLKLVSAFVPLRVSREHEMEGLDISQHGEALQ
jgi:ammonia channel protein AmtB